jgi:hypothetical protein
VELEAGGQLQVREVSGGTGFASQSELRVHFGLGDRSHPQRLTVRWPSVRLSRSFRARKISVTRSAFRVK